MQRTNKFRPINPIEAEQFLGIVGGTEEPLVQVLADDRRTAAFAVPVLTLYLLAGQRGIAVWAEVDRRKLLVGQPVLVELLKEPLGPAVILGVSRNDFSPPVKGVAHGFELAAHFFNVGISPGLGMNLVLDGGVFRWEAERVETNWEEHVVALHALKARAGVRRSHRVPMPDVKVTRGIGQHGKGVKLGLVRVTLGFVQAIRLPAGLPLGLDFVGFVMRYAGWVHHFVLLGWLNKKSLRAGTKIASRYHPASHHENEQLEVALTGFPSTAEGHHRGHAPRGETGE